MAKIHRRKCVYCQDYTNLGVRIPLHSREAWLNHLNLDDNFSHRIYLCPTHFRNDDIVDQNVNETKVKYDCLPINRDLPLVK